MRLALLDSGFTATRSIIGQGAGRLLMLEQLLVDRAGSSSISTQPSLPTAASAQASQSSVAGSTCRASGGPPGFEARASSDSARSDSAGASGGEAGALAR